MAAVLGFSSGSLLVNLHCCLFNILVFYIYLYIYIVISLFCSKCEFLFYLSVRSAESFKCSHRSFLCVWKIFVPAIVTVKIPVSRTYKVTCRIILYGLIGS
jgi:hypothetical protein